MSLAVTCVSFMLVGHWHRQWLPSRLNPIRWGRQRTAHSSCTLWHICTVTTHIRSTTMRQLEEPCAVDRSMLLAQHES